MTLSSQLVSLNGALKKFEWIKDKRFDELHADQLFNLATEIEELIEPQQSYIGRLEKKIYGDIEDSVSLMESIARAREKRPWSRHLLN